jgi:ribosomal protein L37E
MAKQHPFQRIAKKPKNYKYCRRCRKINWHKNSHCIACGHQKFRLMDDEYARTLLLDWEKEPDLLLEV